MPKASGVPRFGSSSVRHQCVISAHYLTGVSCVNTLTESECKSTSVLLVSIDLEFYCVY